MNKSIEKLNSDKEKIETTNTNDQLETFSMADSLMDLEKKARDASKKNEQLPRISYNLLFAAHSTVKDLEKSKTLFNDADIIAHEGTASAIVQECYQEVSDGFLTPEEALQKMGFGAGWPDFIKEELKWIAGTRKKITFLEEKSIDVSSTMLTFRRDPHVTFEEGVNQFDAHVREWATSSKEREGVMLKNLQPAELIKKYPELKRRKELKVAMWAGAVHTPLAHELKRVGAETKIDFSHNPLLYGFMHEVMRQYRFNKPVSENLRIKAFCEFLILITKFRTEMNKLTQDTIKLFSFTRAIVSQFTENEIKELFLNYQKSKPEFFTLLKGKLHEKGIEFPKSEEELDYLLKNLNPLLFLSKGESDNSAKK